MCAAHTHTCTQQTVWDVFMLQFVVPGACCNLPVFDIIVFIFLLLFFGIDIDIDIYLMKSIVLH